MNALVVLSGGQDSATCLGIALNENDKVSAIAFDYGQRHKVELQCAKKLCKKHKVDLKIVKLDFMKTLVTSALTTEDEEVDAAHPDKSNLPASFVPNRNALFLTLAHAYAQEIGAVNVYTGVCQTDYSGYPDCRDVFIRNMQRTLNDGYETTVYFRTPMMFIDKAETFQLAEDFDFLEDVIELSHTCYNGDRDKKHDWGYGCGQCPACKLREAGYEKFIAYKKLTADEN